MVILMGAERESPAAATMSAAMASCRGAPKSSPRPLDPRCRRSPEPSHRWNQVVVIQALDISSERPHLMRGNSVRTELLRAGTFSTWTDIAR